LGKAAGLDAKQSVDALSNAMLQFGVDASDPAKLAAESGRFINVLAASAKVGAAEIPQVSEAILQAGVAAKGAGLTFEETNAAIQGLAVGGKVGSEAGVALRNVISKLIDGGGEQKKVLASVGLSYQDLGKALTTAKEDGGGLASALEMLKGGLDKIKDPAAKAAAAGKLFGAENASAAGILLDQVDNIKLFTDGVTGTNEATVQAAINQDTLASRFEKVKAAVEVGLIKAFQALTPIVKFLFDNFATIATYLAPLAVGLAAVGVAAFVASPSFGALTLGIGSATTATIAWTAALLANPVFLIAAGVAVAALAIVGLADAMSVSPEETLENEEAQKKLLETQMAQNKEAQQQEIQTQALVNEFQTLAGKSKLSADEQKRLQEIQAKLDEKYPKLIDQTKSYKENLSGVAEIGKQTTTQLGNLKAENDKLEKAFQQTARNILYAKRDMAIGEIQAAVGSLSDSFTNALYNAKTEESARKAKAAFFDVLNARKASGDIDNEEWIAAQQAAEKAYGSAVAAINFYKKEVTKPLETKIETKVVPPPKGDDEKKPKKSENKQLAAIEELIAAEKKYREESNRRALDESVDGKISKERKLELLEAEKTRLNTLLEAGATYTDLFNKEYKSLNDVAKITIDATGKVSTGIAGDAKEKEKAVKAYDEIVKRLTEVNASIKQAGAADAVETLKTTLDDFKKQSDDLRKLVPEKLTTKYAFTIDEETFTKEIDTLKQSIADANKNLAGLESEYSLVIDDKQSEEIKKVTKENQEIQKQLDREFADIVERVRIERQTDANKRALELSLFDLRVKYEKEAEENKGNYTRLQELESTYLLESQKLRDEYDRRTNFTLGLQAAVQSSLQRQFNIARLIEERKANSALLEEKRAALNTEESDLEKSLAERTITFEEYQAKIADINKKRIDEGLQDEKLGDKLLQDLKKAGDAAFSQVATEQSERIANIANARREKQVVLDAKAAEAEKKLFALKGKGTLDEFAKAQEELNKAQQDAADNDEMVYGFRTSVLEDFAASALTQFATLAASGKATLADFGKVTVQLAFEALQKMIPIYVTSIYGEELAKGFVGIATGAALTAVLYGLFAAAQSAAGFKDGVVGLDGAGTETSDSIPAWLSRGESVITARATKENKNELEWMNKTGLPLREFYRNQFASVSVNENGELVNEIRQLRTTTEQLGVRIQRNTQVEVSGMLYADSRAISAVIETHRKKNSRRFS
jgi:TP901 family phage tail tape measure protein